MENSLIGRTLNGTYSIEKLLADGGMSQVYLAEQISLGRKVAIKVLLPGFNDEDFIELFLREARINSHLNHSHIVSVVDFGITDDKLVFLAMEYLNGQTLDEIIEQSGALSLSNIVWLLEQLCSAIHAAHKMDVVHRDLKPGNIMVARMAGDEMVTKVVDFGISKPMAEKDLKHTQLGMVIGTPGFLAPEQIEGARDLDVRADIYALGAIVHYLATGKRPFAGSSRELIMQKQLRELPPPLAEQQLFDRDCVVLQPVINKAMARQRDNRYASVAEFWQDFLLAIEQTPNNQAVKKAIQVTHPSADEAPNYQLAFEGELSAGIDRAKATANLQRVFKISAVQAAALFRGKRLVLRKNLTLAEVKKLALRLLELGVCSKVEEMPDKTRLQARRPDSLPAAKLGQPLSINQLPSHSGITFSTTSATTTATTSVTANKSPWSAAHKVLAFAVALLLLVGGAYSVPQLRHTITDALFAEGHVRGVESQQLRVGLSAAFSGSAKELGRAMRIGIESHFKEVNAGGGIHGRKLQLVALDDRYEPAQAKANLDSLLKPESGVFALIGNVGTPTAKAILPRILEEKTILFGPMTGADFLRRDPPDRYVFNYRASYAEETAALVHYFVKVQAFSPQSIAVFYQNDSFGKDGLNGVIGALKVYGVSTENIITAHYERNTSQIEPALQKISAQLDNISAIIIVGTYAASAEFTRHIRQKNFNGDIANVSFVGAKALAENFREMGNAYGDGVIVSQVVPMFNAYASGTQNYQTALKRYHPNEQPNFISLEGYIAANIFTHALRKAGRNINTDKLITALESIQNLDLGIGTNISFRPSNHQASHRVWGSVINSEGEFESLSLQ